MTATATTAKDQEAMFWIQNDFDFNDVIELYRFIAPNEDSPKEPIKILTVTEDREDFDEVDVYMYPAANGHAFDLHIASVSASEMQRIREGVLDLPPGWDLSSAKRFTCPEPACAEG